MVSMKREMNTNNAAKAWTYLNHRVANHYYRLVTDASSEGLTIGEIQVRATKAANEDLIKVFGFTATELMEFML